MDAPLSFTAFVGNTQVVSGPLETLLPVAKDYFDRDPGCSLLIFQDSSGRQVDFDLSGSLEEMVARAIPSPTRSGPGRPRLGVVAREISLLPRHWEWLEQQPSGASAAIRKLVDEARAKYSAEDRVRLATEAASRFLSAMAGNFPGYEEATRALFARDTDRFGELMAAWPRDIREYARRLASPD